MKLELTLQAAVHHRGALEVRRRLADLNLTHGSHCSSGTVEKEAGCAMEDGSESQRSKRFGLRCLKYLLVL